jgi:GrpB-like predicted nucleotidyltransferase (UPF0157 family)
MPHLPSPFERRIPASEQYLRAHTVGELKPLSTRISIVDYDPQWPHWFQREAERIRVLLGDRAHQIEHVGSTSVPGLAAKPVVDILLIVANSSNESEYVPPLERGGYQLRIREPEWHEHRMFKGPDTDINLHVLSDGCAEIERILMFRDWLRNNESDRSLYVTTKRDLAQKDWKYAQNYADAKTAVIEAIMAKAAMSRRSGN